MRISFFAALTTAIILAGGMPARCAVATSSDAASARSVVPMNVRPIRVAIMVCSGTTGCYRPQSDGPKRRKFQPLGR
jgi:hypothetical protein